ncbi:MAG: hypothetical protein P4M00_01610 [Azospirillaceae bacterium]|nr:hypothetical protein [Azospirillaceae bacterium]
MTFLQFESFGPLVHEAFRVRVGDAVLEMTLAMVQRLTNRPYPGQVRVPFRLRFHCARQVILPQGSYGFENADLGKLDIFIVPLARDRDGVIYEAIFN